MKKYKAFTGSPVLVDPRDICNAVVGLKGTRVLHYQRQGPMAEIGIEQVLGEILCSKCRSVAKVKDRPWVIYVDLPFGGTPVRIAWRKHRMACREPSCDQGSWTLSDHRIAAARSLLTTRAAKWATKQVGGGRTITEVAKELGCDWGVVMRAVELYGKALLAADKKRVGETTAIGFDETLFVRTGKYRSQHWATTVCDVAGAKLIDVVKTRDFKEVAAWVKERPAAFREGIEVGTLDMSNTYAAVFSVTLPKAIQVVDRFHVVKAANSMLDAVRRRVQSETTGHRGHKEDPLYKSRKLLVMRERDLDEKTTARLASLLALGDPTAEVALAYRVKEALAEFYELPSPTEARRRLEEIVERSISSASSPELQRLGRTLRRWFEKIMAYHQTHLTNGPTEGLNNLLKRVKRVAFGFTNFENFRIRALLYAGKPNWRVLDSIVVK